MNAGSYIFGSGELKMKLAAISVCYLILVATDVVLCEDSTYRGAVVEFSVDRSSKRVENNLDGFKNALNQINNLGGAQIVVFPEDGIIGEDHTTRE